MSIAETVLALALLALLLASAVPALAAALSRGRVDAAARDLAGELAWLRGEAIATGARRGMRLAWSGGRYVWSDYADGDGDGVRADDIAAGRDPLVRGPTDLRSRYDGVDFGLLDVAIPGIPPGGGALAPLSDPVRFGRSDIVTFSPDGTSSSGTLYVSDGRDAVMAVVVYGGTGRIRIWRYDRASDRWRQ